MRFEIHRCQPGFVRPTVERDHYLHRWPDPRSLPFAYCLSVDGGRLADDGRPLGLMVMKKLQHHRQRGLFGNQYVVKIGRRFNHLRKWRELAAWLAGLGAVRANRSLRGVNGWFRLPTPWQVQDLSRVWVHPDWQARRWQGFNRKGEPVEHTANIFSRMVSGLFERVPSMLPGGEGRYALRLQEDWLHHHPPVFPELPYHVELLVSYCELSHHDGTGYRASGFERWGWTSDGTKEIYFKRLRAPRFKYVAPPPPPPAQRSLLDEGAAA